MTDSALTPSQAKQRLIVYLLRDAQTHEDCQFHQIGQGSDDFPRIIETDDEEGYLQVLQVMSFWDFWQDARNHGHWDKWSASRRNASAYYPGVRQTDWPVYARRLCESLQENREMDEDINRAVFHAPQRPPFWERWFKKLGKKTGWFCLVCCLLGASVSLSAQPPKHSYMPPDGYVPDAKTAMRIAGAVWSPIYGEAQIQKEKPFHASLTKGIWTVEGSLPKGWSGGVAVADISKQDGRILRISHGK